MTLQAQDFVFSYGNQGADAGLISLVLDKVNFSLILQWMMVKNLEGLYSTLHKIVSPSQLQKQKSAPRNDGHFEKQHSFRETTRNNMRMPKIKLTRNDY